MPRKKTMPVSLKVAIVTGVLGLLGVMISTLPDLFEVLFSSQDESAECGDVRLEDIRPPALLEGKMRLYTLVGAGFCNETAVFVQSPAWVGSSPTGSEADSAPASVDRGGKVLTVYIYIPRQSGELRGTTIIVRNPNRRDASLWVPFQR